MVSGKFSLAKLVVLMEKTLDIFDQKLDIFGQNGVNQCFFWENAAYRSCASIQARRWVIHCLRCATSSA